MSLSRQGIIKLCSAAILLPISSSSFAQIVFGPGAAQQVPVMSPLMTITLGLLVLFLVAKLLKDKGFGKSAMTVGGMGLLAAISAGGYQWVPAVQAGSPVNSLTISDGTINSSRAVASGTNVYQNTSGVTLKVISITGCNTPSSTLMMPLCTVNLSVPTGTSCELTCL